MRNQIKSFLFCFIPVLAGCSFGFGMYGYLDGKIAGYWRGSLFFGGVGELERENDKRKKTFMGASIISGNGGSPGSHGFWRDGGW